MPSPEAPIHARIEALEQFNPDAQRQVPTGAWWSANPVGMLRQRWMPRFVTSGGGNGGPPGAARRRVVSSHEVPVGSEREAGVQSVGTATPGDYFEFIARQTSSSTKNLAADDLTWFALKVVE